MIKDWLKNQLTPEKRNAGLWPDFADALQALYEEQVEPLLKRVSDRKSFFTMHPDDLDTRISEYGQFFIIGDTNKASRPILLAQRLDEVHFKGTDRPIVATFWREFGNLPVSWEPLYAPVDQERFPYGYFFTTASGVEIAKGSYGEFFLTSRGTINVDLNKLYEIYGYAEQDKLVRRLMSDVDRIVKPLLPLEMVFDGITLRLDFQLQEAQDTLQLARVESSGIRPFLFKPVREQVKLQKTDVSYVAGKVASQSRALTPYSLSHDAMPLDAWRLDLNMLIPPVITGSGATDGRLREDGDRVLLDTLGMWGCVIEFVTGDVQRFAFPGWTPSVAVPFPIAQIRKVSYTSEHDAVALVADTQSGVDHVTMPAGHTSWASQTAEPKEQVSRTANIETLKAEMQPGGQGIQSEDAVLDRLPLDAWILDQEIPKS